jgi:hypothetical protein
MKVAFLLFMFFVKIFYSSKKKKYFRTNEDANITNLNSNDSKWEDVYYDKRIIDRSSYTDLTVNEKVVPKIKYNTKGLFKNSLISLYKEFQEYHDLEDSDLEELN